MRHKYLMVIEYAGTNYSAYAPDVPGCITTGKTIEETVRNFEEALQFHLEGTFEDGDPAPYPYSVHAQFVEVEVEVLGALAQVGAVQERSDIEAVQSQSAGAT